MNIKDFMNAVDYRITGGSTFLWSCFGDNARYLDSDGNNVSSLIVFDTNTQEIYLAEVHDYNNSRSYKWTNPKYSQMYINECILRRVNPNNAYDDVNFVELDVEDDFLDKCFCIVNSLPYDTRVQVPVDLDNDTLFQLMLHAHDRDITLNELVSDILLTEIEKYETNNAA